MIAPTFEPEIKPNERDMIYRTPRTPKLGIAEICKFEPAKVKNKINKRGIKVFRFS